jgi:ribokinase
MGYLTTSDSRDTLHLLGDWTMGNHEQLPTKIALGWGEINRRKAPFRIFFAGTGRTSGAKVAYRDLVTPPKLLGVGNVYAVVSTLSASLPMASSHAPVAALRCEPGAGVALALQAARRLGCSAVIAGTIGDDTLGRGVLADLAAAGIETAGLMFAGLTGCTIATVTPDGWTRQQFRPNGKSKTVTPLQENIFADVSGLLLDGTTSALAIAAAELAKKRRIPVIAHLTDVRDGTGEIIALADVVIASERAASDLSPRGELRDALSELIAMGPKAAIITAGERGAFAQHRDVQIQCPVPTINLLDSYGASSVFHGAFAVALLSELPFGRCVEIATAAASLFCQSHGTWQSCPDRNELMATVDAQ